MNIIVSLRALMSGDVSNCRVIQLRRETEMTGCLIFVVWLETKTEISLKSLFNVEIFVMQKQKFSQLFSSCKPVVTPNIDYLFTIVTIIKTGITSDNKQAGKIPFSGSQ